MKNECVFDVIDNKYFEKSNNIKIKTLFELPYRDSLRIQLQALKEQKLHLWSDFIDQEPKKSTAKDRSIHVEKISVIEYLINNIELTLEAIKKQDKGQA